MQQILALLEELLRAYLAPKLDEAKQYTYAQIAIVVAVFLSVVIVLLIGLLFLITLTVFLTLAIGEAIGSFTLGGALSVSFNGLLLLVAYINRDSIIQRAAKRIYRKINSKDLHV